MSSWDDAALSSSVWRSGRDFVRHFFYAAPLGGVQELQ
jgi:hypothetical protein